MRVALLAALLSLLVSAAVAAAPSGRPAIRLNGSEIAPGASLEILMGVAGPPDRVQAVRGKEISSDYVKFAYDSSGLSFHLKTVPESGNVVEAIVVMHKNIPLINIPFRIGDNFHAAIKAWGKPERQEPGFLAYWKKGVYVGVSDNGEIVHITLVAPGHLDDEHKTGLR